MARTGRPPDSPTRLAARAAERQAWAARIKRLRSLLDCTQAELAARIGVATSAVSAWEVGRAAPNRARRAEIARLLLESDPKA